MRIAVISEPEFPSFPSSQNVSEGPVQGPESRTPDLGPGDVWVSAQVYLRQINPEGRPS